MAKSKRTYDAMFASAVLTKVIVLVALLVFLAMLTTTGLAWGHPSLVEPDYDALVESGLTIASVTVYS